jgi:hypothetical protein
VPRNVTEKLFSSHSITLLRCPAEPAEAVVKSVMQAVAHAVESSMIDSVRRCMYELRHLREEPSSRRVGRRVAADGAAPPAAQARLP